MVESTFKRRVEGFWAWYAEVGARLYQTIETGRCADLSREIAEKTDELSPDFAWVFGPGPDDAGGHSFTLSGDGRLNYQLLAEYWLKQAPPIEGWTFYASRQPSELSPERSIKIDGYRFVFGETTFSWDVNEEYKCLDLHCYNPVFSSIDTDAQLYAIYLILDEVLGEFGTGQWIGSVSTSADAPANAKPLLQLRDVIHDAQIAYSWEKPPPTKSGTVYQGDPDFADSDGARMDTTIGSTSNWPLIRDFLAGNGSLANPIPDTGADFVYVEFSTELVPHGSETEFRGEIEEAIDVRLQPEGIGQGFGGAFGLRNTYVDFLLFDTDRGLEIIRDVLAPRQFAGGVAVHFFAEEKRDQSIVF